LDKNILKSAIFWLGHRDRDEEACRNFGQQIALSNLTSKGGLASNMSIGENQDDLSVSFAFSELLNSDAVIFPIITWETSNLYYVKGFISEIKKSAKDENRVCPIILDDLNQTDDPKKIDYELESAAAEIALPCHCQNQMTVIGAMRCVELIRRIMGYDTDDCHFPNYRQEFLKKMARHLNRQSYNKRTRRENALNDYKIINGVPDIPEESFA